nr:PREDICTED: protein NDR1-like [Daucus carota subsp. sativus]
MVKQGSISCSIEDFYIANLQSSDLSNLNQSIIYFKLHLGNNEDSMGVYYESLNLTFSYHASAGNIVPVGNYTIPGFHQGINKETDRNAYVVTTPGNSWQQISKSESSASHVIIFRVDLGSAVKFRELFSKAKSKTRKIMAWADVEVDPVSGKKTSEKAIKLKHMIEHHVSGGVTFVFAFMIIVTILTPYWCFLFLGCVCRVFGH